MVVNAQSRAKFCCKVLASGQVVFPFLYWGADGITYNCGGREILYSRANGRIETGFLILL